MGKASFDEVPAAPPFGNPLRFGAKVVLRAARLRTHRRLKRRDANSA